MTNSPELSLLCLIDQAHAEARAFHGDFELGPQEFAANVLRIIDRRLGAASTSFESLTFLQTLHLSDLYLAMACGSGHESAWSRYSHVYGNYIHDVARLVCQNADAARDLADRIGGHIFLPDRAGRPRIASYDGRSSFKTWLSAIIKHLAIDERALRANNHEPLDCLLEAADSSSLNRIETAARASRYEQMIASSLEQAVSSLTEEDRRLLSLRYVRSIRAIDIAKTHDVDPTTIRRQLSSVHSKVRDRVVAILATQFHLSGVAIEECLEEIVASPAYSVLQLLA